MKHWMMAVTLTGAFSSTIMANDVVEFSTVDVEGRVCESVVCKNIIKSESVNQAGEFPERKGNETLSAIGNILFVAGEIGLAENLQEEEPVINAVN
ncbi:hypothetical protein [Vibrio hyugaensis]|uniref:hypothetical protein n=1 Tax=Vibrio hyugaensis TaxID=1534743 RepID=UPI0005F068F2|nr:hypothetical protein [Vibrio hyugaensis]